MRAGGDQQGDPRRFDARDEQGVEQAATGCRPRPGRAPAACCRRPRRRPTAPWAPVFGEHAPGTSRPEERCRSARRAPPSRPRARRARPRVAGPQNVGARRQGQLGSERPQCRSTRTGLSAGAPISRRSCPELRPPGPTLHRAWLISSASAVASSEAEQQHLVVGRVRGVAHERPPAPSAAARPP